MKRRKAFSREFKLEAVRLLEEGNIGDAPHICRFGFARGFVTGSDSKDYRFERMHYVSREMHDFTVGFNLSPDCGLHESTIVRFKLNFGLPLQIFKDASCYGQEIADV
jgi:hypothetical protein